MAQSFVNILAEFSQKVNPNSIAYHKALIKSYEL